MQEYIRKLFLLGRPHSMHLAEIPFGERHPRCHVNQAAIRKYDISWNPRFLRQHHAQGFQAYQQGTAAWISFANRRNNASTGRFLRHPRLNAAKVERANAIDQRAAFG